MKVAIFVDGENLRLNGGNGLKYSAIKEFASRCGKDEIIGMSTYLAVDAERLKIDNSYRKSLKSVHDAIHENGWRIKEKKVKWYKKNDKPYSKANADIEICLDAYKASLYADKIILATGDGDFSYLVQEIQGNGCSVEVIGLKNVSHELQKTSDFFISGFLLPNMINLSTSNSDYSSARWGEINSRVAGTCFKWDHEKNFGFFKFLKRSCGDFSVTDSREEESPYGSCFVHGSAIPKNVNTEDLPSRDLIFSFKIQVNESTEDKKIMASEVELIWNYDNSLNLGDDE